LREKNTEKRCQMLKLKKVTLRRWLPLHKLTYKNSKPNWETCNHRQLSCSMKSSLQRLTMSCRLVRNITLYKTQPRREFRFRSHIWKQEKRMLMLHHPENQHLHQVTSLVEMNLWQKAQYQQVLLLLQRLVKISKQN